MPDLVRHGPLAALAAADHGAMPRVLLVRKTPLLHRLAEVDLARLTMSGVVDRSRLSASAAAQAVALEAVRAALDGAQVDVVERGVEQCTPRDAEGVDLVVTVGGDGTVFAANLLGPSAPLLTVNSDPERSVGHFTRCTATTVAAHVAAWRAGRATLEGIPRLLLTTFRERAWVLNDVLITCTNPAAMSRYVLEVEDRREFQRSSGVWVATGAGSTAAIHSAGAEPLPPHVPALLWRTREPFPAGDHYRMLDGVQLPPRRLCITPAIPGMAAYLDGPNRTLPLDPGEVATFTQAVEPLRLVRLPE